MQQESQSLLETYEAQEFLDFQITESRENFLRRCAADRKR